MYYYIVRMNGNSNIAELVKKGFTIVNVGGKTTKAPLTHSGFPLSSWENLPHNDMVQHFKADGLRFGMRMGKQGNGRYCASLDFDCCGKKDKDGNRIGCDYTKDKLQQYNEIKTKDDGLFKGGTDGNYNLLIDFTDSPELMEGFKKLEERGKKKVELHSLEMFFSNGSQQVIPPSATKSKITNEMGANRQFLNDQPILVLSEGMPETNYVIALLNEYKEEHPGSIPRTKSPAVVSSEEEEILNSTYKKDRHYDLLFRYLGNGFDERGGKLITREDWLVICGALIHNGYDKQMWLDWNELYYAERGHKTDSADKLWDNFEKGNKPISLGAVNNIAKKYKPKEYAEWREHSQGIIIDKCVMEDQRMFWKDYDPKFPKRMCFTDVAFADIFTRLYGDKFRFTGGYVYHFNGVYWERDNRQYSNLHTFIDNIFYHEMKNWILGKVMYWTKRAKETDEDDNNKGISFWGMLNRSVKEYMKTQRSKMEMIKSLCSKICNEKQEWDMNPYLFVFKNCVFDLRFGVKVEPNPQDFMTTCCGWDYDDHYVDTDLMKVIETIQPDKEVRDYLLKAYYGGMLGIQDRGVKILTGKGGNGKSVLDELVMNMLGGYAYALPKAFLTEPIKSGANPEAMALYKKRLVLVSEPDANRNICCSSLKALSGDCKITSRRLYGEAEDVKLDTTSVFIECNTPPKLDEMNQAMNDRLGEGVIQFGCKFVSQSAYDAMDEEDQKKVSVGNPHFKTNAFKEENRQTLFHLLLPYRNMEVPVPKSVLRDSKKYMGGSDVFYDWFIDVYEKDEEEIVKMGDLYEHFKEENGMSMSKMDKEKYKTQKKFIQLLTENIFVGKYVKVKDDYYNKTRLRGCCLAGWKRKGAEEME